MKLTRSQYQLLAGYLESISKAATLYNVVGFFLPSILPTALKPSLMQFSAGTIVALTSLIFALILIAKGEKKK